MYVSLSSYKHLILHRITRRTTEKYYSVAFIGIAILQDFFHRLSLSWNYISLYGVIQNITEK